MIVIASEGPAAAQTRSAVVAVLHGGCIDVAYHMYHDEIRICGGEAEGRREKITAGRIRTSGSELGN